MSRRTRLGVVGLGATMALAAALVAVFVGRGDGPSAVAVGGGRQTVDVQLADMRIVPSLITVPAGTRLVLQVTDTDTMRHDLYIDGHGKTPLLAHEQSAPLDLGTITRPLQGWCTVPGHKAAGMTMTIRLAGQATATSHPVIDFGAAPGPDWIPYDPRLQPIPPGTLHRATFTIRDTLTEIPPACGRPCGPTTAPRPARSCTAGSATPSW